MPNILVKSAWFSLVNMFTLCHRSARPRGGSVGAGRRPQAAGTHHPVSSCIAAWTRYVTLSGCISSHSDLLLQCSRRAACENARHSSHNEKWPKLECRRNIYKNVLLQTNIKTIQICQGEKEKTSRAFNHTGLLLCRKQKHVISSA